MGILTTHLNIHIRFFWRTLQRIQREIKVWSRLKHPNVLPFLGPCILKKISFMTPPWMENGHALKYVQGNPESDCLRLPAQVANGLPYLHGFQPPVIHGDLKGPNILISKSGDTFIADFGLSELKVAGQADPSYPALGHLAGHPRRQALEPLKAESKEQTRRTMETDIFAFGRAMLELFTKDIPFSYISPDLRVAMMVINRTLPKRPSNQDTIDRGLGENMWELMKNCWDIEPARRPSAKDIAARLQDALDARSAQAADSDSRNPSPLSSSRPAKRAKLSEGIER